MSYDSRCHDLADLFLQDEPGATAADTDALAQQIQDAIETFPDALAQQIQDAIETFLTCELPDRIRARATAAAAENLANKL